MGNGATRLNVIQEQLKEMEQAQQQAHAEIQQRMEDIEAETERTQQETREDLLRRLEEIRSENEDYRREIDTLRRRITELKEEARAREDSAEDMERRYQQQINDLESKVSDLQNQLQGVDKITILENSSDDNHEYESETPSRRDAQTPVTQRGVHVNAVSDNNKTKQGSSRSIVKKNLQKTGTIHINLLNIS